MARSAMAFSNSALQPNGASRSIIENDRFDLNLDCKPVVVDAATTLCSIFPCRN